MHDTDVVAAATCNVAQKRLSFACVEPNLRNDSKRERIFHNL